MDKPAAAETESDVHDDAEEKASVKNDIASVTSWRAAVAALQCTVDARRSTHSAGRERGSTGTDVARIHTQTHHHHLGPSLSIVLVMGGGPRY